MLIHLADTEPAVVYVQLTIFNNYCVYEYYIVIFIRYQLHYILYVHGIHMMRFKMAAKESALA